MEANHNKNQSIGKKDAQHVNEKKSQKNKVWFLLNQYYSVELNFFLTLNAPFFLHFRVSRSSKFSVC